jgi:hypothetical protein
MKWVLLGIALCSGCAFDHGTLGSEPGDDDGSGMGSDVDTELDVDGDGVPDFMDDCPEVGDVDQRDHDDDGHGDACDVCPHLVDTGSDTDLDGVGDACDPRPTEPGDRIAFFEGFYADVAWRSVIGANTWQATSGTLRQQNIDDAYQLVRDDNPDLGQVFVDARVRVNAIADDPSARRSSGLVLAYRDTDHYIFCGLAATAPQGAEVNAGQVSTDFFGSSQYDYTPGPFPAPMAGEWLTLQARTTHTEDGTRIDCTSHRGEATGTASYEGDADVDGDVGIRTNGADASFDYVFVVAIPASSS